MRTILVVEDEPRMRQVIRAYLEQAGFRVVAVGDGPSALHAFRRERPDLIVLDLMLPGMDGFEVCRAIRRESGVPIIILTARVEEEDRVVGLELGADDYITKPFSPRELVARVRAVLRRAQGEVVPPAVIRVGDLTIDLERRAVQVGEREVHLTPTEFELLATMARPRIRCARGWGESSAGRSFARRSRSAFARRDQHLSVRSISPILAPSKVLVPSGPVALLGLPDGNCFPLSGA